MNPLERFDRYLEHPREEAYNLFLDERNLKIFKIILFIFIIIFIILFALNLGEHQSFNVALVLTLLNLTLIVGARIIYKNVFNVSNIRKYIFIFLVFQMIMSIGVELTYPAEQEQEEVSKGGAKKTTVQKDTLVKGGDVKVTFSQRENESFVQYIIFFGIMVLIFRFSRTEIIQLFSIAIGVPIVAILLFNVGFDIENGLPNLMVGLLFFIIAFTAEKKRQRKFTEQYNFNYKKNYENIRMKKELNYAREIQLSMLPENNAIIGELEISAISIPASEVGGDYFDYFKISESQTGLFICDVSGHGVASGLMLSGLRSSMHLILEDNSNPKVIAEKLNRMIRKTQSRKMFVTAIFAVIDCEKNKCTLFNAGHLPPYKISRDSGEIFRIKKHGIALGAMNSVESSGADNDVHFDFRKGDKIIFYTDGVNEAMNKDKAEYGLDNLERYLNSNSDKKADDLLNGLIGDIKKFSGDSVQRDDLTLLIIQRN